MVVVILVQPVVNMQVEYIPVLLKIVLLWESVSEKGAKLGSGFQFLCSVLPGITGVGHAHF